VTGPTPHSREPRIFASASSASLLTELEKIGIKPSEYQGPASVVTYLIVRAREQGLAMATLVAETPAYLEGYNARCIEAVIRCLAGLLNLPVSMEELRTARDLFNDRIAKLMKQQPDLAGKVKDLERSYDREAFDNDLVDLRSWLENKGIRAR
jgi:proteasome assembly chaperone (PAC2) family protein